MASILQLQLAFQDIVATRYATVAFTALLLWDHVITLGDEITLIWPAKVRKLLSARERAAHPNRTIAQFGIVKAIFLFNRYAVPIWIAVAFSTGE
ncbi:hypothetical protein FRC10_001050 [Ceratobasidium sp. 414]|nr:hypothetical protein FRC10_001050 [Ceratobasidium sp. 414]